MSFKLKYIDPLIYGWVSKVQNNQTHGRTDKTKGQANDRQLRDHNATVRRPQWYPQSGIDYQFILAPWPAAVLNAWHFLRYAQTSTPHTNTCLTYVYSRKHKLTYATLTVCILSYVILNETGNYQDEVTTGALGAFLGLPLYPSPSLSFSLSPLHSPLFPLSPALESTLRILWTSSQTVTTHESCLLKR